MKELNVHDVLNTATDIYNTMLRDTAQQQGGIGHHVVESLPSRQVKALAYALVEHINEALSVHKLDEQDNHVAQVAELVNALKS